MDGFQATEAIRALEAGGDRRTPIIAMTANASSEDRDRCLLSGMDDHVAKPVKQADLAGALARWVHGRPG
jgi:CheY-like chemotaxis protein